MSFRKFFGRSESNKSRDAFKDWPLLPTPRLPQFLGPKSPPTLKPAAADELRPGKYGHSLIIGLGESGCLTAQGWLERLQRDSAGYQRNLRLLLISDNPVARLTSEQVKIRQFELQGVDLQQDRRASSPGGQPQSIRAAVQQRFETLSNFNPFWSYLNTAIRELVSEMDQHTDVRVMLIACLDESEMGLLGDLLQLLQVVSQGSSVRFANVTLLLAINGPATVLNEAEQVAALREIGRFTFSGRHLMNDLPYVEELAVDGALLDFVFLFEDPVSGRMTEAMAESLFTFLHPSSAPIWENLRNELSQTGNARSDAHLPFVNSLGLATLFVPVDEIKQYVSSRLAYAVVFGELNTSEGLLAQGQLPTNHQLRAEKIGRAWFLNSPQSHPFWPWLLDMKGPQQFLVVPAFDDLEAYRLAFQAQLAQGLMILLNDDQEFDSLQQAATVLHWFSQKLDHLQSWYRQASINRKVEGQAHLSFLLESFQATVKGFQQQVAKWEMALGLSPTADVKYPGEKSHLSPEVASRSGGEGWRTQNQRTESAAGMPGWRDGISDRGQGGGWRSQINQANEGVGSSQHELKDSQSLRQLIKAQRQAAEKAFEAIVASQVKRPLTYSPGKPLREVAQYYEDTIRPELSRHGLEVSPRFQRVRERLGWWVDLPRNRPPELILICLPVTTNDLPEGIPSSESRFRPEDTVRLSQALLKIALSEAQTVVTDLTGQWMEQQLAGAHFRDFLSQAEQPLLAYDQFEAMSLSNKYASITRRYIIGRDRSLTSKFKETAFRNVSAVEVNDVPEAESYLLTALSLRLNIPLRTIKWFNRHYDRYNHQEDLHLYWPERLAAHYENNLTRAKRSRYELPPELVMTLTDERLVSLFCQAVFAGCIRPITGGSISGQMAGQSVWALSFEGSSPNWFLPLELGLEDGGWRGLWRAMKQFTLELPFGPAVRRQPAHPFYPANREQFLEALIDVVRESRRDVNSFQKESDYFETTYLRYWEANLQDNRLGRAFLDLLKIELARPLWRGW